MTWNGTDKNIEKGRMGCALHRNLLLFLIENKTKMLQHHVLIILFYFPKFFNLCKPVPQTITISIFDIAQVLYRVNTQMRP